MRGQFPDQPSVFMKLLAEQLDLYWGGLYLKLEEF